MKVGIMSDSHGRHDMVRRAVALFDREGVESIIHCGDVCGIEVFDELVGRSVHFVWGNCDVVNAGVLAYLETVGLSAPHEIPLRVELGGKRFAVFHGHEPQACDLERTPDADYILHGHSHRRRDERIGSARIINPGALQRANPKTVAVLDTDTDELAFHELD